MDANELEQWLADYLEGYRVPASGALSSQKGDVIWSEYLVDSKNTEKSTIPLKTLDLIKISREGREAGKTGHLILTFLEKDEHWAVVPEIDCNFESLEETLTVEAKSVRISSTFLTAITRKAKKKNVIPSVYLEFSQMKLGTPRRWLIIPLSNYKELFKDGENENI